jgi:hypothetical protein
MSLTEEDLKLKINLDVGHSVEKLEQARQLLDEFRAIQQRIARAEALLLALLKDWEVT